MPLINININFCLESECAYYFGDLHDCMMCEEGVPSNLERKCQSKKYQEWRNANKC